MPLRFGVFIAPYHAVGDNPTLAFQRDLELVACAEQLGFDEAWFGEHHSAGTEIIGAPDLCIMAAAERTRRIRLGTGVTSLPYHHPFMLADRMVQLDHMTHGRAMLGVGPGALPGDAYMMGIETSQQRRMMEESLEAILALWRDEGPVERATDWFTLRGARLQLRPYTRPHMEVAVASNFSPSGPRLAGQFGTGLLSIAATQKDSFEALARHWRVAQESAAEHGTSVRRDAWRLVGPMHLAPSLDEARRESADGLAAWVHYFRKVGALPILGPLPPEGDLVDAVNASGVGVIGTPEMALEQLRRLERQTGGFGTYLLMMHDWADRAATLRSLELFARHVMPALQDASASLAASRDWTIEHREQLVGSAASAIRQATDEYRRARKQAAAARAGADDGGTR